MANTYPQLTLVTAAFAASMENNLVASKLVRWRPRKNASQDPLNKFKYVERVAPRYNVRRWNSALPSLAAGKQSTAVGAEVFTLDDGITLDYDYADFAHIRDEDTAARDERLRMIGMRAGEDVDADVLRAATTCGCNWTGTPGNTVDDIEALLAGYVRLKEEGVPDGDIMAVLAYSDMAALAKYLVETPNANMTSQEATLANVGTSPRLKTLLGMKIMFTQQLPVLTTGTRTNGAIVGNDQDVDYTAVAQSTTTNGQYLTQTLSIDGLGANATVKDGEVFTIEGVNAWDNRKGASQGRLQEFRVIGDHQASGTGAITDLRIFPAIIVPSATLTGTAGINNAHATVSAAPVNDAVVTWKGSASTEYLQRAIIGRQCIRVETADLEDAASGENSRQRMRSVPLSLHAYRYTDGDTRTTSVRFDAAYKPNVEAYGRYYSVRING